MAAPSYTTDLAVMRDLETTPTFGEMVGYITTGTGAIDTDYPIQGVQHASAAMTKTGLGSLMIDNGANITWTSGWYFFVWGVFLPANAVNTFANGGLRVLVGPDITTNFKGFKVGGRDFGRYPYGGWQCFAVNPELTADYSGGTVANYRWVGIGIDCTSAISKGNPLGVDVIRYGRGQLLVTAGDLANGYATFDGMATANDGSSARWGLFQSTGGSFLWKGLMSLGSSGAAVDFRHANRVIVIEDQRPVSASFNRIEVSNAASRVDWTAISITSLNTVSKGQFEALANADINLDACTFVDMDTFIFQSNSYVGDSIFRRCGQITAGGASFVDCLITNSTATSAIAVTTLNILSNCTFESSGTGHAVNLGTIAATASMNWNNFATGYAGTNGATGNETILVSVAASQTLTINVGAGYTTPTIYNTGAGTVTVVSGQVTTTITVLDVTNGSALQNARVYLVAAAGGPLGTGTEIFNTLTDASGQVSDIRSLASNQPVTGWVRKSTSAPYFKSSPITATISNANGLSLTVQMIRDE